MPTIQANGCDFYYELEGEGPDLVFIHGEIHGLEYWEHQIPEFARDHRCFAYNRRGHAKTASTNYGFSLVNQTRDLAHLIDHFGMKRPVLIAVAFGTTIAANYAIQYPDRVKGVVLAAWSEMHDAMQYFQRWEKYNQRAADVLESRGRDALVSLLRDEGGKTIYRVIPVDLTKPLARQLRGGRSNRLLSERIVGFSQPNPFRQEVFRWLRSALFAAV